MSTLTGQEMIASAPPSIALAMMAMNLAHRRKCGCFLGEFFLYPRRKKVTRARWSCSGEYYRIIDRLAAGEAP